MRKNDFFKYLLLNGGSNAAKRSELETQTLPYTFTSDSHTLRNYRIYGTNDGIGDLDSMTNKYIIPVEINGTAVNISLDSPLDDGDYIDFREQKRFNSDDSSEIVSLPVLPILSGINVIDVGTENQPSKVYVQGNISSFSVSSWANVQKLVRAGLHDKYFAVGDQLVCQKGNSDLTWDIIGFDHDTPTDSQYTHSMTLQLHDCLPSTMQFDAPEALYYAENGLAAGETYNFTIQSGYDTAYGGGKTYQFKLENDVPTGGQLTFGWTNNTQASNAKITSYSGATSTTPIGQVSVTEGNGGTSLGTTDGTSTNVNYIHKVRYGSNNPVQSALRQFLNSDKSAGNVWTPQTNFDRPPAWAGDTAGFMSDLDSDFLAVIGKVNKTTALNTVTDGGGSVTLDDKFFLLSRSEVYGDLENNINEGSPYPYYKDYSSLSEAGTGNDSNRIKYRSGTAQTWRLRSPYSAVGSNVRNISQTGGIGHSDAGSSNGVSPACNII